MTKAWRLGGAALMMAASAALCAPPAAATVETPGTTIQIGQSPSGNYLAALIASADRDTNASAIFYREALRDDPRNPDLIERAFAAALSDGDAASAFSLADRLILRDPANSLARLALAVRAIADGQYVAARTQMSFGDAGRAHDVTTGLLTAWSYAGQGDLHHALDTLDHIHDASVAAFRDFHAGLIADLLGNPIEARRRLKSAYEADKNLLRFGDVYARFLANHGDKEGATNVYEDYAKVLSHHPLVDAALADLKANKPLEPLVRSARDGAPEPAKAMNCRR
jgi:tetratricopeptide (TPR) repeat protein